MSARARAHQHRGDYTAALGDVAAAIAVDGHGNHEQDALLYAQRGRLLAECDDWSGARDAFAHSIEVGFGDVRIPECR
jgi:hypothetical protein